MKINAVKTVQVDVKTIKVHVKVCDRFCGALVDSDGQEVLNIENTYVPDWFPGDHYGDYLILDIDLETGQILNWKSPSVAAIEDFLAP